MQLLESFNLVDIAVLDLRGKAHFAEHMVLATAKSSPQMKKAARVLSKAVKARKVPSLAPPVPRTTSVPTSSHPHNLLSIFYSNSRI